MGWELGVRMEGGWDEDFGLEQEIGLGLQRKREVINSLSKMNK